MSDFVTRDQLEARLALHDVAIDARTQARIDGAIQAASIAQEQRWTAFQSGFKEDISNAVTAAFTSASASLEQRLDTQDRERHELATEIERLRITIHGNPSERSGHPSIFEMFQAILSQVESHDDRIEHLEGIEKAAVDFVRWIGKAAHKVVSARLTHFVTAGIALILKLTPLLVGAIASAIAAAEFFMHYLFRIYQ